MAVEAAKPKLADAAGANSVAGTRDPAHLKIRDLVYRISGIYHSEQKMYLLVSSCSRRMSECGIATPSEYLDRLTTGANRDAELKQLLNEITIGETYMFRHPAQLDALSTVILPQIMKNKTALGLKRLRFWSAGCSTGEEPYTLAIFLNEEKQLAGWNFEILATDLNTRSLEASKAGIYGEYALRNIAEPLRRKYFKEASNNKLEVNDLLRSRVRFDRVNLSDDSKMVFLKGIDVIFCCNVLIYFDLASKKRVVQHFFTNLLPGGYFFLGHAESLYQVDDTFRLVHFPGTTAYWKAPPGAAAAGGGKA
ncbi:MAG TPA: protein-glutamate O-methyltransferase CheR [Terriglobales bacterium]|nr:protein-glutamate O-methyltransferase CheR [Terriglobales bacterium]